MDTDKSRRSRVQPTTAAPGGFLTTWLGVSAAVLTSAAVRPQEGGLARRLTDIAAPERVALTVVDQPASSQWRGWTSIGERVYRSAIENRILAVSAGITFYGLLAIFPAMAALLAIYGLFADIGAVQDQLSSLAGVLPDGAIEIIGDQVKRIASKGGSTLGLAFAISFATSLWSANAGMKALIDGLNIAYGRTEKRSFIRLNLVSLGFTLGAICALLLAMVLVVVVPLAVGYLGLGDAGRTIITFGRWPTLLLFVILALAVLYRFAPSPDGEKWRWITPGSLTAAIAWLAASAGFSYYASNFGSYNATYGSLGAAVGLMTWIWISMIVVLAGAELNGQIEAGATSSVQPAVSP